MTGGGPAQIMEGERRSKPWSGVRIGLTGRILILVNSKHLPKPTARSPGDTGGPDLGFPRSPDIPGCQDPRRSCAGGSVIPLSSPFGPIRKLGSSWSTRVSSFDIPTPPHFVVHSSFYPARVRGRQLASAGRPCLHPNWGV